MAKRITKRYAASEPRKTLKGYPYHDYVHALGDFAHRFSSVELAVHNCVLHHSKVSNGVGRAVFSGVRIKEGISFLRRLADAGEITPAEWGEMKPLLEHLNTLTDRRNALLHYGAEGVGEGAMPFVSNSSRALTWDKVDGFPVTARILRRMTRDINTIFLALSVRHSGNGWAYTDVMRRSADRRRAQPWHYKSPSPKPNRPSQNGKSAKQRRPPQSSRA